MQTVYFLQLRQKVHDEGFHKDVSAFPESRRVAHLLLHLGKYVGRLAEMQDATPQMAVTRLTRTMADTMLVALSLANICEMNLSAVRLDLDGATGAPVGHKTSAAWLCHRLAIAAGRLNKAYDDFDHGGHTLIDDRFRGQVAGIILSLLETAALLRIDIDELVHKRWAQLENT